MKLFEPVEIGRLRLKNRVVMSPMTRSRANAEGVLPDYAADYYGQRATAGLIVTEGTQPSPEGQGYARTPGISTPEQIRAWEKVTREVHAKGGLIFLQAMHTGRVGHSLNRTVKTALVSASAISAKGKMYTDQSGLVDMERPVALTQEGISTVVEQYAEAARNAFKAGFDGIELHGATGYLPHQFFSAYSNQRNDEYGGSVENRARFILQVLDRLIEVAEDSKKVGIRLSPGIKINDIQEVDPKSDYPVLLSEIETRNIAYVNVHLEPSFMKEDGTFAELKWLRKAYRGTLIAAGGFTKDSAAKVLSEGYLDCVGFGAPFVSNPDLVYRLKNDLPLTPPDHATFYVPGPKGYVDYPEAKDPMEPASNERFPDWQNLYEKKEVDSMPWFHPGLDPDLKQELQKRSLNRGKFLDIGTGPGTQAEQLCKMGFTVTGTDLSLAAIEKAKTRFKELAITFVPDDILNSTIEGTFDYAFDRGCFHVLPPIKRSVYVATVSKCLKPEGILFLKCFSSEQPDAGFGPWRFTSAEIRATFGTHFQIATIQPSIYQGTLNPPPKALFCVLVRK